MVAVDSKVPGFISELETLDSTSCRTCDTVHVFYVRAGQKFKEEILANVVGYFACPTHSIFFHALCKYWTIFFCLKNDSIPFNFIMTGFRRDRNL